MQLKNVDSIIFDLDGTLWDASTACAKAWNKAFEQTGIFNFTLDEPKIRSFSGLPLEKIFSEHLQFIPPQKKEELHKLYKTNEDIFMKQFGGELFPYVEEVLTELKNNYKLFIVSNCLAGYIENFIEFHKLQNLFSDFESSGNTGLPKSENLKLIVERNKLKNAVFIGDTIWDQEAANKAGIPFIYAAYGFGKVETAELKIEELKHLKNLLPV